MSTEITKTSRTFFDIVSDLAVWQETLEFIEAKQGSLEPTDPEYSVLESDHSEIIAKREELGLELIAKVDGIAAVDRRFDAEIQLADEAAKSATKHRKALEAAKTWLRDYVMNVMEQRGIKHMKTPTTTIQPWTNGGSAPVIIEDVAKLPLNLCREVGWVRADYWKRMCDAFGANPAEYLASAKFNREPQPLAISKALQEPCPMCQGNGTLAMPVKPDSPQCMECHGSGKAKVPGARLAERGRHLRIT